MTYLKQNAWPFLQFTMGLFLIALTMWFMFDVVISEPVGVCR